MSQSPITVTYTLEQILGELKDSIKEVNQKIDTLQQNVDRKFDTLQKDVDQKIDTFQKEVSQKIDTLQKDITELKLGQSEIKGEMKALDEKLSAELKLGQSEIKGEMKALDEKLSIEIQGLSKRVDNQEFTNRGILIALVVAILGGAAKLFGFVGNP